jgi:uncharacterized protein YjaG (DUF416 family)
MTYLNDVDPKSLKLLSKDKQLAFILLLCERMVPALRRFANDVNFNDSIFRKCLDISWRHLDGEISISNYSELAAKCLNEAPDTEVFDHSLTSAALNAALAVGEMMEFLADHSIDHLLAAAGLARDTTALYAQSIEAMPPNSLGFNDIMDHPLIKKELWRQAEDLEFLKSLPTDNPRQMIPLIKEHAGKAPALLPPEN